jgi:hypothetical protein
MQGNGQLFFRSFQLLQNLVAINPQELIYFLEIEVMNPGVTHKVAKGFGKLPVVPKIGTEVKRAGVSYVMLQQQVNAPVIDRVCVLIVPVAVAGGKGIQIQALTATLYIVDLRNQGMITQAQALIQIFKGKDVPGYTFHSPVPMYFIVLYGTYF